MTRKQTEAEREYNNGAIHGTLFISVVWIFVILIWLHWSIRLNRRYSVPDSVNPRLHESPQTV